jgi:uncharacterized iron-regulated membrane protein
MGLWALQASTGLLIVFHWELADAQVPGAHRATDLDKLGARVASLDQAQAGHRVATVWATAGAPDRYDITVATGDRKEAVRVAGDGAILRVKDKADRGAVDTLVAFHQSLLAGDNGRAVIGVSGGLLLITLGLGASLAWPRANAWGRALRPTLSGPPTASLFGLHRAMGLWLVVPAVITISAGALLAFEDPLRAAWHSDGPAAPSPRPGLPTVGFAAAVRTAEAQFPGSRLTMVQMPSAKDATYKVRVLAPGEPRRAYGLSTVFVDATTGEVRKIVPTSDRPLAQAFMDTLYAVHTGEALSLPGRLLNMTVAVWLIAMATIGLRLRSARRHVSRRGAAPIREAAAVEGR